MFEVKESPLHGRGLFATQTIPEDTVIGLLATEGVPDHELEGPYVLWVGGKKPVRVTCELRFINHSDEANVAYYDDLTVVSLRDIQPGEELVHDYMGDAADDEEAQAGFEDEVAEDQLVGV